MKYCPKCKIEHTCSGNFCSRSCANSRVFTDEAKEKKRLALKGKPSVKQPESLEKKKARIEKVKSTRLKKYLATPFDELGSENRRRRVFEEQGYKCNRCGIDSWLGETISFELDHKDGNNKNNLRENLEGLCPNCHSLTPTWRGRNKISEPEIADTHLLECLQTTDNIRGGLLKAGISAKGSNYARAKKLLGV